MAVQADGKIVLAGQLTDSTGRDFALLRYDQNGSLDSSFDGNGVADVDFGGDDEAGAMALQPDGKIVVGGWMKGSSSDRAFALARHDQDGSPDTAFDGDGVLTTQFAGSAQAHAVAIQPDGRILLAGDRTDSTGTDFAVARYGPDGSLDPSFDGAGKLVTDFGSSGYARAVAVQTDGKIVVAGQSDNDFALARYNADGSLDASFDGDGKLTTDIGALDSASAVGIQSDGKIVAGGHTNNPGVSDVALARYGRPDDDPGAGGSDDGSDEGAGGDGGGDEPGTEENAEPDAADTTPPALVLRGRRSQRLGRFVKVRARCADGCELRARGRLIVVQRAKAKAQAAAKRRFKLRRARAESTGKAVRLKLKLSRKARRVARRGLRRGRKVRARVTVVAIDAAGNRTKAKREIHVLRAYRGKRRSR